MSEEGKTIRRKCPICLNPGHTMVRKKNSNFFRCSNCGNELAEETIVNLWNKGKNIHQLVSITDYAKLTHTERRKVYRLIQAGKLTLYRGVKGEPLLDPTEKPKDDTV